MLDYLLPEEELVPWILGLGGWLRLTRSSKRTVPNPDPRPKSKVR